MADNNSPIGVFDSGVGGLTILSELKKLLPKETFIYVADQKYAPYGKKTKKQIAHRALKISSFLGSRGVKMIIVACNTATIASINILREKFRIPIIGVVPVIKTLSEVTHTGKTAVFATPATINSTYLSYLIDKFANDVTVYKNGLTGLEDLIETGTISSPKIDYILKGALTPLKESEVDAIALGCTHYPFLKNQIQTIVGHSVKVLDSGSAVARQTGRILQKEKLLSGKKRTDLYYTTKDAKEFERIVKKLTNKKVLATHIVI